jgi:protein O-GlcNAc transferase
MSFASRVASSLLHNVGLQHLIPRSWAEYEDITTVLALSPEKMDRLHKKLRHSRWNSPLFDARGWVADFERSLRMTLESMQSRRKGSKLPHTVVAGL